MTHRTQRYFSSHYSNSSNFKIDSFISIQFRIRATLKPSAYYDKYSVDILSVNHKSSKGKCLLNIYKDSLRTPLNTDAWIV
ncbi:MAG: hypothetical protein HRT67_12390 [Flavobacteriaceae bacterium]|nr:hypothetical protein [Flavobacteriaceae bacterium]